MRLAAIQSDLGDYFVYSSDHAAMGDRVLEAMLMLTGEKREDYSDMGEMEMRNAIWEKTPGLYILEGSAEIFVPTDVEPSEFLLVVEAQGPKVHAIVAHDENTLIAGARCIMSAVGIDYFGMEDLDQHLISLSEQDNLMVFHGTSVTNLAVKGAAELAAVSEQFPDVDMEPAVTTENPRPVKMDFFPVFTRAMREIVPDLDPAAVVYSVDAGDPHSLNIEMEAGVVDGRKLIGSPVHKIISKEWFKEFNDRDSKIFSEDLNFKEVLEAAKYATASDAYEAADFGGWSVEGATGWETDGPDRFTRKVFLDVGQQDTLAVPFSVNFHPGTCDLMDTEMGEFPEKDGLDLPQMGS